MAEAPPHPVDVHVGRSIRARRKQLGVSQGSLGEALGVSFQQIQKYERATNRVSCSALVAIATRLQCAPADLLPTISASGDNARLETCLELAGAPHGLEIAASYVGMDPDRQRSLLGVVRALATRPTASAPEPDPDQVELFDDGAEPGRAYVAGGDFQEERRSVA